MATPFVQIPELKGPIDDANNLFIRPASKNITAIWYKYDNQQWYWTPYEDGRVWISVKNQIVPIGKWKGKCPALPNIKIIEYLCRYQPKP